MIGTPQRLDLGDIKAASGPFAKGREPPRRGGSAHVKGQAMEIPYEIEGPSLEVSWPTGFEERLAREIAAAQKAAAQAVRMHYLAKLPEARAADGTPTWADKWETLQRRLARPEPLTNRERQQRWRQRQREQKAQWEAAEAARRREWAESPEGKAWALKQEATRINLRNRMVRALRGDGR